VRVRLVSHPFVTLHILFFFFLLDKRLKSEEGQRSINLVLSSRGLAALHAIDPLLEERLMEHTIPIHSRMIHMKDGRSSSLQYDRHNQASSVFFANQNKASKNITKLTYAYRPFDSPNRRSIP